MKSRQASDNAKLLGSIQTFIDYADRLDMKSFLRGMIMTLR
jgi:hypothetical protein